jgi:hypothetical protein
LEYELAKIPCLPDCVCLQSCATFINVFVCSSSRYSFGFGFLLVSAALLAATLVQKNPPVRPADARRLPGDLAFFLPSREGQGGWKEISVDRLFAAKIVTSGESQGRLAHYLRS